MEELPAKFYSATPNNLSRHIEGSRFPYIAIDIKKKRLKLTEKNLSPKLINLSNQVHPIHKKNFPTPKKLNKKFNRPEELSMHQFYLENINLSPAVRDKSKSPKVEESLFNFSPKGQKYGIFTNLSQIKLGNFESNENATDKTQIQNGNFPVTFKVKKGRKASKSVSSTLAFEKVTIPTVEPAKIENILKNSSTPTPEMKIPKYIRHESFKAGYFLGKIDKILNRIRADRSKSSFKKYILGKNNLKNLLY